MFQKRYFLVLLIMISSVLVNVINPSGARSQGSPEWVSRYAGPTPGEDRLHAITTDIDGNIYVTGESEGTDSQAICCQYHDDVTISQRKPRACFG